MRNPSLATRGLMAGLLVFGAAGCTSLRPITLDRITAEQPSLVYVVEGDGLVYTVENPFVESNVLIGTEPGLDEVLKLPVDNVAELLSRQPSTGKTAAFVGGLVVLSGSAAFLISKGVSGPPCNPLPSDPSTCTFDTQPHGLIARPPQ